jgi:hypothetical protein
LGLTSLLRPLTGGSRLRRELILAAAALFVGVAVAAPLVFVVGSRAFGPYAGGGLGAFMGRFFKGLAAGSTAFWIVALGPYVAVVLIRLLVVLGRRLADTSDTPPRKASSGSR